MISETA